MRKNIKYELEIVTNSYTGNFERELCLYVFGWCDEDFIFRLPSIDKEFLDDFKAKDIDDLFDNLYEFYDIRYDEHGLTMCEISGSSSNNLIINFNKNPKKYLSIFLKRLNDFPKYYSKQEFGAKNLTIIKTNLYSIETTKKLIK